MRNISTINRLAAFVLLAVMMGISSCAGTLRNYGAIRPSEEVRSDFDNFKVSDGLRYYISGSDLSPNAIMGLNRKLRLDPRTLWKEVSMTPVRMKELIDGMRIKIFQLDLRGFELTTPDGIPVGVWYSLPTALTLLRVNEDGSVWIETPDIDTYEKYRIRLDRD